MIRNELDIRSGSVVFTIDDLSLWYNVTSLTSKPTNVPTNSRFEETDTRKIYYLNAPILNDDFTSYATQGAADAAWVTKDTSLVRVNITNDNLAITNNNGGYTTAMCSYDLGFNLGTSFIIRFKANFTTLGIPTSSNYHCTFGIASVDQNTDIYGNYDWIGVDLNLDFNAAGRYWYYGGRSIQYSQATQTTLAWAINTNYYIQLKKIDNRTYQVTFYSDPNYTTVLYDSGSVAIPSGASFTALRYLGYKGDCRNSANIQGTVDDIKVWNGATSVASTTNNTAWGLVN